MCMTDNYEMYNKPTQDVEKTALKLLLRCKDSTCTEDERKTHTETLKIFCKMYDIDYDKFLTSHYNC